MSNDILARQNSDASLRLLKAQRVAYSMAKKYQMVPLVSALIAIASPILLLLGYNYSNYISVFGLFWAMFSIAIETKKKRITRVGATIQEQFDVKLFDLDWNNILAQDEVEVSKIVELSKKYGNKDDIRNWYSEEVDSTLPRELAILLHYKTNIMLGNFLRSKYAFFLGACTLTYYVSYVFVALYKNTGIFDFSIWIAPSLSFLVYCISAINNHLDLRDRYNSLGKSIDKLIPNNKTALQVSNATLRQIQDVFFIQRLNPYKVPTWFYLIFKKTVEKNTDDSLKMIKERIFPTDNTTQKPVSTST